MTITLNGTSGVTTPNLTSTGTVTGGTFNGASTFGFKNRIINGAMVISQRNGTSSVSETGNSQYTLDRWQVAGVVSAGVFSVAQSSTAPTGFINSLLITVTTADSTLATNASYQLQQKIEGFNCTDLAWGTASASTVTISFWVRSSLTGTFGGALTNSNYDWTYPFSYTISSANTWEQKSITVAGPTSGTWLTTNGIGLFLVLGLGANSGRTATAGVWANTIARQPTGSVNLISTNGATFYITGVQLETGTVATTFDYRPYGTELQLCQRYCQYAGSGASGSFDGSTTTTIQIMEKCVVTMRAAPAGAIYSGVTAAFRCQGADLTAASPALANYLANVSNVGGTSFWTQVTGFTGGTANAVVTSRNNQPSNGGNFILLTAEL